MSLSRRQLAMRRDAIGGSAIAALAGLSRWATPIEIYDSMVNGAEKETNLVMRLGTALEDPVADIYAEETGRWLRKVDTCRHPTKAFAIATPDRAVFSAAVPALSRAKLLTRDQLGAAEKLLEVKTTSWRLAHEWGTEGTDEIPEHHLCQVQWTLGVCGKRSADVSVLFDRDRIARYAVRFSEDLFDGLLEIGERFLLDHVAKGVPPPPDASDYYGEFLARRFPVETGEIRTATPAEVEVAMVYGRLKEASRRLEVLTKRAGNELRAAIGAAASIEDGGLRVTWKKTKDTTKTDWEGVATEARELAARILGGGADLDQARTQLDSMLSRFTATKPGYRVLRLSKGATPVGPLTLELPEKTDPEEQGETP